MRNVLPLASLGCIATIILGVIVGGVVMLGYGLNEYFSKKPASPGTQKGKDKDPPKGVEPPPGPAPGPKAAETLESARRGFHTAERGSSFMASGEAPDPVADADVIKYSSPGVGELSAYFSKPRRAAKRRPAVVWAHGGFGAIGPDDWEQARPFHDADCELMVPSFRGENKNKGQFEMFYGEVDDLLAAVEYVRSRPGVDPGRVYVAGHSSGGTLVLLAATTGTTKVRAFFSVAGLADVEEFLRETNGRGYAQATPPFDVNDSKEARLRSALPFVGAIRRPVYFFAPRSDALYSRQAEEMERRAKALSVPFEKHIFANPDHFTIVGPTVRLLAKKVAADTLGKESTIRFEPAEMRTLFPKK